MGVTLTELLESRDNRQLKQNKLIDAYGKTVVSLTIVIPGPVKKNGLTSLIASKAVELIKMEFAPYIVEDTEYDLNTGFEALYVVSIDKKEAKRIACFIEDEHPWGRLFDIDVIGDDKKPLSRGQINREPRKCLVCEEEAHYCVRNRSHSLDEILSAIENLVNKKDSYVSGF